MPDTPTDTGHEDRRYPKPPPGTGGVAPEHEMDRAAALARTDPTVRRVVEHLLRVHSVGSMDEARRGTGSVGVYYRHEPDALLWVAWDAVHAIEWGCRPSLCPIQPSTMAQAIECAFYDSGLHDPDDPDSTLAGDVAAVLEAIGGLVNVNA